MPANPTPAESNSLRAEIEGLFDAPPSSYSDPHFELFRRFKTALNEGFVRAAEPDSSSSTGWRVNAWVKKGILLGFRMGKIVDQSVDPERLPFLDKDTLTVRRMSPTDGVRIVPGGSSIRDGCFVGQGVICMPPMFINVGAYVGDGTLVDSHALVGSCAQIGCSVHLSAAAQIGGVLEPIGALPVIIEDEVLVGGNSGVYEGTVVKRRAVLGTGTILNRSTPVYDLVREKVYSSKNDLPLVIPEEAVVIAGSRAISRGIGKNWGISLYTPVIVKYRDARTDSKVSLEDLLR
jgi:2,3,4,5-tetrahydropyridine-2,6-dicarboxylate N-succinyltransferase